MRFTSGVPYDDLEEASRRTRLANERTYLAWWRTGLTAFAAAVGAGKLVPELSTGAGDGYAAVGVAFGVLGAACCAYAVVRYRATERALRDGGFAAPHPWAVGALGIAGALVGLALVALILWG